MAEQEQNKNCAGVAEIECPVGHGKVKFTPDSFCPISMVRACKDCTVKGKRARTENETASDLLTK